MRDRRFSKAIVQRESVVALSWACIAPLLLIMAALVQTFPQQTATVTLLPSGPVSAAGAFSVGPSMSSHPQHTPRSAPVSRTMYNAPMGSYGGYRAPSLPTPPVASYAATLMAPPPALTTGNLNRGQAPPHLKQENRTFSAPASSLGRANHDSSSVSTATSMSSKGPSPVSSPELSPRGRPMVSKDDSTIAAGTRRTVPGNRPLSTLHLNTGAVLPFSGANLGPSRPSPERYRRGPRRSDVTGTAPGLAHTVPVGRWPAPSNASIITNGHVYDMSSPSSEVAPAASSYRQFPPSSLHRVQSSSAMGSVDRFPNPEPRV